MVRSIAAILMCVLCPFTLLADYRVYRDGELLLTTSEQRVVDSTVVAGQTYTYNVVTVENGVESDPATIEVTIPPDKPAPPENLQAEVTDGSVILTWGPTPPPPPPSSTGFFSENKYKLAKRANIHATDLSGLTFNTRTKTLFALNEGRSIVECDRDGNVLRTIITEQSSVPVEERFDTEAIAYLRTEGTTDVFALTDENLDRLLFVQLGPEDSVTNLATAESHVIEANDPETGLPLVIHEMSGLAYDADTDVGVFHIYTRTGEQLFIATLGDTGIDVQYINTKGSPICTGGSSATAAFQNSRLGNTTFILHGTSFKEVTDHDNVTSEMYISKLGKVEGLALDPDTKEMFVVRESSPSEENFYRYEPLGLKQTEIYDREAFKPHERYDYVAVQEMADNARAEGRFYPLPHLRPSPGSHPKLFIHDYLDEHGDPVNNKAELKNRISTHYTAWMQEAIDTTITKFGADLPLNLGGREAPESEQVVLTCGLIYQLGEIAGIDLHGKTPEEYGSEGVRHLLSMLDGQWTYMNNEYLGLPLGYDWLYDLMTVQQREAVALELLAKADPRDISVNDGGNAPSGARLLGAVAVTGDGINDALADKLVSLFHNGFVFGDTIDIYNEYGMAPQNINGPGTLLMSQIFAAEGPGFESLGYSSRWTPLLAFLIAWRDYSREDYFKLPFFQNWVHYLMHADDEHGTHFGQAVGFMELGLTPSNPELAALVKSYTAHYFDQRIIYMLTAEPAITAQSPSDLELPTTAHFRGVNSIFSRNSWTNLDSTKLFFWCPNWLNIRGGGAGNKPVNNILISKNQGRLLRDLYNRHGYGTEDRSNSLVFYNDTIPDVTHVFPRGSIQPAPFRFDHGASIAEAVNSAIVNQEPPYNDGVRYFQDEPGKFLYISGDGARYHHSSGFKDWNRQIVWFRNASNAEVDHFVLCDRVEKEHLGIEEHIMFSLGKSPDVRDAEGQSLGDGLLQEASSRFARAVIFGILYSSIQEYANDIAIEFIDPGVENSPLSASVINRKLQISLGTAPDGQIVSGNGDIVTLINSGDIADCPVSAHYFYPTWNRIAIGPTDGPIPLIDDGGIWKYDNAISLIVSEDIHPAHAKGFIRTLLPANPIYYRLGGISTRNIDLFGNLRLKGLEMDSMDAGDPANIEKGMHRIQITAPERALRQIYLHTIQADDLSGLKPQATSLIESAETVGARTGNNIALFGREKTTLLPLEVTIPPDMDGDFRLLAANLKPNTRYTITINQILVDTALASEVGIIFLPLAISPGDILRLEP